MATAVVAIEERRGIRYWMERVIAESTRVRTDFAADPVHDLRVAIRRCRSIAEGINTIDPDPRWRKMRRAGKQLFSVLGQLRDVQVLTEWVRRLSREADVVAERVLNYCAQREALLKVQVGESLQTLDADQWLGWASILEARVKQLPANTQLFEVIALRKLQDAMRLHRTALRNRTKTSWHALRIGIKKFRYVVENFLPQQYESWGKDLKQIQDSLGEIHDLDVLWATALNIEAFSTRAEREHWHRIIEHIRLQRVQGYRQKTLGQESLWHQWRKHLPTGDNLHMAILKRFEIWASFLDREPAHAQRVLRFCLRIYDGLLASHIFLRPREAHVDPRALLTIAALVHEVGRAEGNKDHHKRTRQMLAKLEPPPGWTADDLQLTGLIARYHRGALPDQQHPYRRLSQPMRQLVAVLSGILRLADQCDVRHGSNIQELQVHQTKESVVLLAAGYQPTTRAAERIAAARHLLETACGLPILLHAGA